VDDAHEPNEVKVASAELEATFLPGHGMRGSSLRHAGEELLEPPRDPDGRQVDELRGLPLLAPWANRLGGRRYSADGVVVDLEGLDLPTDPAGLPIHGTMANRPGWEVAAAGPASLRATFAYDAEDLLAAFPFPHTITLDIAADGPVLSVATTLTPTGDRAVPVSFGFHPYFRLPGVGRDELVLRLPDRHLLCRDGGLPTGWAEAEAAEAAPLGDRAFDHLFALGDDRRLGIEGDGRRIEVVLDDGYRWAQVFAPAGSDFVCLEPMTAPVNALVTGDGHHVAPGETFTARFTVHVGAPNPG
jgi:galactose mutarotase-like enzyme